MQSAPSIEISGGDTDILVTSCKSARRMLDCSNTHLYELINSKEIESYRDGKSRKILIASIRSYVARKCATEDPESRSRWTDHATKARALKRPRSETGKLALRNRGG